MKNLRPTLVILLIVVAFTACSKNSNDIRDKPLIKSMAFTTYWGRYIFNCTYDDQKRLISTGADNNTNPITYNLGGFQKGLSQY